MKPLRKPSSVSDITPELLDPIVDNLRKLSNLSGTGCTIEESPAGLTLHVQRDPPKKRGRLLEDLYACSSALATEQLVQQNNTEDPEFIEYYMEEFPDDETIIRDGDKFRVYDPLGKVSASLLAMDDPNTGESYIPAGTCLDATFHSDSEHWEVDEFGLCCMNPGSGSGGGSGLVPVPQRECGVPCPPDNCQLQWLELADGSGCRVLVCCPASGSGGAGATVTICGCVLPTTITVGFSGGTETPYDCFNGRSCDLAYIGWQTYTCGGAPQSCYVWYGTVTVPRACTGEASDTWVFTLRATCVGGVFFWQGGLNRPGTYPAVCPIGWDADPGGCPSPVAGTKFDFSDGALILRATILD